MNLSRRKLALNVERDMKRTGDGGGRVLAHRANTRLLLLLQPWLTNPLDKSCNDYNSCLFALFAFRRTLIVILPKQRSKERLQMGRQVTRYTQERNMYTLI